MALTDHSDRRAVPVRSGGTEVGSYAARPWSLDTLTARADAGDDGMRQGCRRGEDVVRLCNQDETSVVLDQGLLSQTLRNVFKGGIEHGNVAYLHAAGVHVPNVTDGRWLLASPPSDTVVRGTRLRRSFALSGSPKFVDTGP